MQRWFSLIYYILNNTGCCGRATFTATFAAAQQQDQGISEQHLSMGDARGEGSIVKPEVRAQSLCLSL